ncbi:TldD/PmbA family protein [Candidatus Borrarchaeum sp.]|uniref:TldD/PmbA family protein n=1 Tax=Candidatus Borrarchaeum sp. TaxID=2846742 RepID=UPI00257A98DF|nr:TldD/PmbA family protein [Candidatus Borrarchaeum sp.]
MDNLFASAERALKFATSKVYQTEIFAQKVISQRLLFAKNAIKTVSNIEDSGIAVRVYDNAGRYGFSYAASLNEMDEIERIVNAAVSSMRLGSPDPDFESLPDPKPLPNVQELYDDHIANSSAEEVIDLGQQIIDAGLCNASSVVLDGTVSMTREQRVLMNSLGSECSSDSTIGMLSASAVAKNTEGEVATNSDLSSSRQLKNLRPQWLGETVAKRACDMLGGKKIETMSVPVILFQNAIYPLFFSIVGVAANADAVQQKRTYLVDKKGKTIASEQLTVIDDGLVAAGFRSLPFDGEGNPKTRQKIIEKGVLRTYLYDTYTAKKDSITSTGNSMRLGYNTLPQISCNNLRITPGKHSLDTLISETKKGVFILALHDSPDPVSGRLSGLLSEAFLIENGEIKHPIKNAMIGIHVFDLLNGISDISQDYREEAGVLIPSIKINNARIAGAN